MKSGMKKTSIHSSKTRLQHVRDFLLQPVSIKSRGLIENDEIEVFSLLIESGLPFSDAISLSFQNSKEILEQLERGTSFSQIIRDQKWGKNKTLSKLCEIFSLDEALIAYKKLNSSQTALKDKLIHPCLYPLVIMAFSTVLVWIFSDTILPMMAASSDQSSMLLPFLKILCIVFCILVGLAALILTALFSFPDQMSRLAFPIFQFPTLKRLVSLQCASLFEALNTKDLSTMECVDLMSDTQSFPFCALVARGWKRKLKKGWSWKRILESDPCLDPMFVRLFVLGMESQTLEKMMRTYQKSALQALEKSAKRFSKSVLLAAYSFVGILALSVYQMMLEPLSMLETF